MLWQINTYLLTYINRTLRLLEILVVPRELKKVNLFSQETYHSQNFRYETLKSPLLKKLSVSLLPRFVWRSQTIKGTFLSFFTHQRMNEYEWIYDWTLMFLKDSREPLLSFELIYFRNSFCYTIENSWGFRYKILGHVGPLEKNLNVFVSLGIAWIFKFCELSVYTEVVLLKTFPQHFELCLYCKYWRSYEVL